MPAPPNGWRDLARQLALLAAIDLPYELVRGLAYSERARAFANGQLLIDLERATHSLFEPAAQAFVLRSLPLVNVADQIYLHSQFSVVLGFMVWLYWFRNPYFCTARNMLAISMGLALVGYVLFPTAPPRLFPEAGFVDTITSFSQINHDTAWVKVFINPYAAVPSLHCAYALMIGGMGVVVCRSRIAKAIWATWPAVVAWVVIVTANHYWIDVALGWLVAAAAAVAAHQLPNAWGTALRLLDTTSPAAVPGALKTLGLSLQPRRAPLEVLVVDSIDRAPTED